MSSRAHPPDVFSEMQKKEKKKKKKRKYKDDDEDEDELDNTYHPSQDYNDDSQFDSEFRPTKRKLTGRVTCK